MIDKQHIEELIESKLENTSYYLVGCTVSKDNQIMVVLDGDNDVSIDQCSSISRYLVSRLDRDQEDYELQVTSYGADKPLLMHRQYRKYLNRSLVLLTTDDEIVEGTLLSVDQHKLEVEPIIKPKKKGMKSKRGDIRSFLLKELKEIKPVMKF
ncbi:MAG: ribosome assembly cofactor RimP [Bacteroidota bacterium]